MKLVQVKCKNCGATLMVPEDSLRVQCEYCDSYFTLDDEANHVKFDNAKQAGYEFERGRIRAQKEEAARQHAASYGTTYETHEESRTYEARRNADQRRWDPYQGAPTQDQKIWAIARLIITFFFGVLGAHKFMDRKIGMGLLYLFTFGLMGIGVVVDLIMEIVELARMYSR